MTNNDDFDFSEDARITDNKLAGDLSRIVALSPEKLRQLLPGRKDEEVLGKLIEIVASARTTNEKIAAVRGNMERFGGVVAEIIAKL